ncbi:hypothetical protein VTN77DRAFT_17 [Rasamsonia byssochlamydoides]|uniref:uncharacterized protein n=1 Tax=Rasamsonia byssochlamydoides TaxID=89139 RepID=UPI0037446524
MNILARLQATENAAADLQRRQKELEAKTKIIETLAEKTIPKETDKNKTDENETDEDEMDGNETDKNENALPPLAKTEWEDAAPTTQAAPPTQVAATPGASAAEEQVGSPLAWRAMATAAGASDEWERGQQIRRERILRREMEQQDRSNANRRGNRWSGNQQQRQNDAGEGSSATRTN